MEFIKWLDSQENHGIETEEVMGALQQFHNTITNGTATSGDMHKVVVLLEPVLRHLDDFRKQSNELSLTSLYWVNYMIMVELILQFIKAERQGNWELHLQTTTSLVPYFHAMDRTNYARWLPIYLADMNQLEEQHPAVHNEFVDGNHAIARSYQPFSQVWTDMALEQSINLDSKSKGGIIGISQKESALERWFLTCHERSSITTACKEMCGIQDDDRIGTHKEAGKGRIQRDEQVVQNIVQSITSGLVKNPFEIDTDYAERQPLLNIVSGTVMPGSDAEKLVNFHAIGKQQMLKFVDERLNSNELKLWDPLPQLKIKTFASLTKKTNVKTKDEKVITIKADRDLFARLVIASNSRNINLKEVLKYELSLIPVSLAYNDGSLRKSNKHLLLPELEKKVNVQPRLPVCNPSRATAYMIDALANIQMLRFAAVNTFGELAEKHFELITAPLSVDCKRVDVVFDQYKDQSIKSGERKKRGVTTGLEVKIHSPNTPVPKQWLKYIGNPVNKSNLCNFLSEQWCILGMQRLQVGHQLIIAGGYTDGEIVKKIERGMLPANMPFLFCNQEEADTRLLLHAKDAAQSCERIIIKSPDTDVLVLSIHHFSHVGCEELWLRMGTKDKLRFIPVHNISEELGPLLCEALVCYHALSGCDSTSGLLGVGKKKAWNILIKSEAHQTAIAHLGNLIIFFCT